MAVLLQKVITILLAYLISHQVLAKTCETEDYEDGVCVPLQRCDRFKEKLARSSLSEGERRVVQKEQEKCADEERAGLICCKRKPRVKVPRSYEDIKPLRDDQHCILPNQSICGLDSGDRIFYGNVTNLDQYPWLVLIKYINDEEQEAFQCGGSLVSKRYVLTAAHCINNMIAGVRLGEWDLETDPDCVSKQGVVECANPVRDVGIEKIVVHKNYTRRQSKGGKIDMALLRLDQDIVFGKYVAPVCIPKTESEAQLNDDHVMFVAGWGMTENDVTSTKKLFVDVTNVGLNECRRKINAPLIKIDETMICALGVGGKDACQGDSGGPLMAIQKETGGADRFFLKGVVSKGLTCGSTKPGFYANVYKQLTWIVSNLEP